MALTPIGRSIACPRGHSFDTARSGYINLLQPQDRRSRAPGDNEPVVAARRRLHDAGVTRPLAQAVAESIAVVPRDTILDVGCGDGYYLSAFSNCSGGNSCGVDISVPAIDAAARRYPGCQWIVANADRFLPYAEQSFDLVLSITGRMNAFEFDRVLKPGGHLLVALAAPDDLIELRGAGRDRVPNALQTFSSRFQLTAQNRIATIADLSPEAVDDVLLSIYRPQRTPSTQAVRVTFSFDLLLFQPRRLSNLRPPASTDQ